MNHRIFLLLIVLVLVFAPVGAQQSGVPILEPEVINTFPHDPNAYTQGLVLYNGLFYESTGANSVPSTLREVNPQTGEVQRIIELTRDPDTKEPYAEGLALVDDQLIQLTWRSGLAFVYDIETFNSTETFTYEGEGWGLCYDGRYIFHSDGTAYLSVRDPQTFELIVKSLVTYHGTPINQLSAPSGSTVANLNELECVGDSVYANVWMSDLIFQEDYAYFSGRGNFATPLARNAPQTDIIMAGELTYRNGGTAEYENCALMSRIVVEDNQIVKGLEIGLDNDGDLYYYDLYGSGRDSFYANILKSNVDLDESHHILFIASGDELTVYFDGEQVIEGAEIDARSGIYAISLNGRGSSAQCEGRNIWVFQASVFEAGVCTISASNPANKRAGPGTNFAQAGQLTPGTSLEAIAQTEDASGFTWWKLEDDTWVREDVVQAAGDCRNLPEGD